MAVKFVRRYALFFASKRPYMSYARYKFNKAVQSLNEAGVKRREWLASDHACRLLRLTTEDVPVELKHEFQLFEREMKPILRASDLSIRQWGIVRSVDEETVGRIIDRIMYMHEVIELKVEKKSTTVQA
jgi:hypothetical protein